MDNILYLEKVLPLIFMILGSLGTVINIFNMMNLKKSEDSRIASKKRVFFYLSVTIVGLMVFSIY